MTNTKWYTSKSLFINLPDGKGVNFLMKYCLVKPKNHSIINRNSIGIRIEKHIIKHGCISLMESSEATFKRMPLRNIKPLLHIVAKHKVTPVALKDIIDDYFNSNHL